MVLHNSHVVWRPLNCTCTVVGKVSSAATGKVKTSTDMVLGLSYFLAKIKARKCHNEITILQMKCYGFEFMQICDRFVSWTHLTLYTLG